MIISRIQKFHVKKKPGKGLTLKKGKITRPTSYIKLFFFWIRGDFSLLMEAKKSISKN